MAKSLLTKMKRSGARDQWEVQGFLFCEILERHLQFEEQSMLPEADKTLGDSASEQLALKFRKLRPESPGKKTTARNVLSLAVDRETSVPSSSAASIPSRLPTAAPRPPSWSPARAPTR